jgi:hypothetical protein
MNTWQHQTTDWGGQYWRNDTGLYKAAIYDHLTRIEWTVYDQYGAICLGRGITDTPEAAREAVEACIAAQPEPPPFEALPYPRQCLRTAADISHIYGHRGTAGYIYASERMLFDNKPDRVHSVLTPIRAVNRLRWAQRAVADSPVIAPIVAALIDAAIDNSETPHPERTA